MIGKILKGVANGFHGQRLFRGHQVLNFSKGNSVYEKIVPKGNSVYEKKSESNSMYQNLPRGIQYKNFPKEIRE